MKTLFSTLVALGLLAGTANAQHVSYGHRGHHGPVICSPGVVHGPQRVVSVGQPAALAEKAPEAPAEAAPEAPADNAPPAEAPLPPK